MRHLHLYQCHIPESPLNLDGREIPYSPSILNLGVIFDYSMIMAELITNLSRSINWQLWNLNRIRKFLDTDTCHNIVRTLILSKLDYCNSLLYGIDKKHLNRLQVLQNKCARLILKQPSRTHTSPLLQSLHWLPIEKRILSSSLFRLSKLFILVLLVICLHIFNRVSTKLNTVSVRIWPLHLRSLVPKNKRAIVPFLWLGQGGRTQLPKFKFSAKFPIGLHVILQIQIKKIRK